MDAAPSHVQPLRDSGNRLALADMQQSQQAATLVCIVCALQFPFQRPALGRA